jgi:hypothetical protein
MFKKVIQNFIRIIQRILIFISLTVIYFLGFGITLFFMLIFKHKILTGYSKSDNTFWIEAKGYEADIEDSIHQS